jgi:hypothetical protein
MIRRGVAAIALVAAVAGCAHRPRAYPLRWVVYGQVEAASDAQFAIRHKSGDRVELLIDERTAFVKSAEAASWRDLLRGSRVIVDVETSQDGRNYAMRVDIRGGGRPW